MGRRAAVAFRPISSARPICSCFAEGHGRRAVPEEEVGVVERIIIVPTQPLSARRPYNPHGRRLCAHRVGTAPEQKVRVGESIRGLDHGCGRLPCSPAISRDTRKALPPPRTPLECRGAQAKVGVVPLDGVDSDWLGRLIGCTRAVYVTSK